MIICRNILHSKTTLSYSDLLSVFKLLPMQVKTLVLVRSVSHCGLTVMAWEKSALMHLESTHPSSYTDLFYIRTIG